MRLIDADAVSARTAEIANGMMIFPVPAVMEIANSEQISPVLTNLAKNGRNTMGKRKPDYYTGIAIHGPERNFWSRYPYSTLMGRKNTYRKYYCGHCCLRIFKTWDVCHSCGQEIDWSHTDNWIGHNVRRWAKEETE